VICEFEADTGNNKKEQRSLLYSILGWISSLFLLLVVVIYFIVPEMRTLQNRSVVFQSSTLAIGLISVTVLHLHSSLLDNPFACKFFGMKIIDFEYLILKTVDYFSIYFSVLHIELVYMAYHDVF
jgi:hypothetical protein